MALASAGALGATGPPAQADPSPPSDATPADPSQPLIAIHDRVDLQDPAAMFAPGTTATGWSLQVHCPRPAGPAFDLTLPYTAGPPGTSQSLSADATGVLGGLVTSCRRVVSSPAGYPPAVRLATTIAQYGFASILRGESTMEAHTPSAAGASYGVKQGLPLTVAAPGLLTTSHAPDGEALTVRLDDTTRPAHGAVSGFGPGGGFTYVPDRGYLGPDRFSYVACTRLLCSAPADVSLLVTVPHPPVARDVTYAVAHDDYLAVNSPGLLAHVTNVDHDALTVPGTHNRDPLHGELWTNADGSFSYVPEPGFAGTVSFQYWAHDAPLDADSNIATVTINVT